MPERPPAREPLDRSTKTMTAYARPQSLRDALGLLSGRPHRILAGGTDVNPADAAAVGWGRPGLDHPDSPPVLDITGVDALAGIRRFGGKLDQSVQTLVALAAWVLGVPVRCTWTRTESMTSTTKRHPSGMRARAVAVLDGQLHAYQFNGDFDTGAYASWGPTVAGRVPVHCMGP